MQTEFDTHADKYRLMHKENISITGEPPEYFSEYKVADLAKLLARLKLSTTKILILVVALATHSLSSENIFLVAIYAAQMSRYVVLKSHRIAFRGKKTMC